MKVVVNNATQQTLKVVVSGGTIAAAPGATVSLKNKVSEIPLNSIEDIPDVNVISHANGATLVFNPTNNFYEVNTLRYEQIEGVINGGTY